MARYKCCVPGCSTISRQDVIFHKFPDNKIRRNKWIQCFPSLQNKRPCEISFLRVCHKHFEARFVTPKSRLIQAAYPSLFLESEILSGTSANAPDVQIMPVADHNYAIKRKHSDHNYTKRMKSCAQVNTEVVPSTSQVTDVDDAIHAMQKSEEIFQKEVVPSTSQVTDVDDAIHAMQKSEEIFQKEVVPSTSQVTDVDDAMQKSEEIFQKGASRSCHHKVVDKIQSLTPKCRQIYNAYRKSKKLLSYSRRCKKALDFSKVNNLENVTQHMNPLARKLFNMQVNMCTKKTKGRRFSLDEKLIALSILKQGPKSYRFLQKIFILPSESTLKKVVSKLKLSAGINPQIFNAIQDEVKSWNEGKKYCSIIFDEMALQPALTYTHSDEICGYVDTTERKKRYADHALVFMIKGVVYKWQQPIAYYLCEGSTPATEMKTILKDIVKSVSATGCIPLTLICDQGASFRSALNSLKEETKAAQLKDNVIPDDTIQINGINLQLIFDPPHLIKGLRNNFISKNIKFEDEIAKWADIIEIYKNDCRHAETRLLHKLNDEHVIPEKIKKMKVKNCVRVLSRTVAAALNFTSGYSQYADGSAVSSSMQSTAKVVLLFDELFDSVNGSATYSKKRRGKELRTAVTEKSRHHAFWQDAINKLHNIKFIDSNGRESTVPSIKNWISTLKSFTNLWKFLKSKDIKIMRPRYLNSDAIENFFGQVRSYNFRDNTPTCHNFINTYKSLLITGFIRFHRPSFNCEDDKSLHILKIKNLFKDNENISLSGEPDETSIGLNNLTEENPSRERLKIQSRAYTAGWVVRKVLSKIKCRLCRKDLTTKDGTEVHSWITRREYNFLTKRRLTYPAEYVVRYFGLIFDMTNSYLEENGHSKNLMKVIKTDVINQCDFNRITCHHHKNEVVHALVAMTVKLTIHNWCTTINKILYGKDIIRLSNREHLPDMQKNALLKYKKRCKAKK